MKKRIKPNKYFIITIITAFLFSALILGKQCIQKILRLQFRPAAAAEPPVKAPKNPLSFTPSIAPVASKLPKPVRGTVAPHPAKSIKGLYKPSPP